jgi:hypothetical protein
MNHKIHETHEMKKHDQALPLRQAIDFGLCFRVFCVFRGLSIQFFWNQAGSRSSTSL